MLPEIRCFPYLRVLVSPSPHLPHSHPLCTLTCIGPRGGHTQRIPRCSCVNLVGSDGSALVIHPQPSRHFHCYFPRTPWVRWEHRYLSSSTSANASRKSDSQRTLKTQPWEPVSTDEGGPLNPNSPEGTAIDAVSEMNYGVARDALKERAPPASEPPVYGGHRGKKRSPWMQLLSFTAVVSAPIIVLALTFKHLLNEKRMEEAEANEAAMDVEAALRQAEKVVSGGSVCVCLAGDAGQRNLISTHVEPHLPESRVLRLPEKDVIEGIPNNHLTDIFTAERSAFAVPFNFIHFAVSKQSEICRRLSDGEAISLLYFNTATGNTLLLRGVGALIESPNYKRHYWRNKWGASLEGGEGGTDYSLVKFVPQELLLSLCSSGLASWHPIRLHRVNETDTIYWKLENS